MRRVFLSVLSLSGLALVGCDHVCSHGVCDCDFDDHCSTRAPWVHMAGHVAFGEHIGPVQATPIPAPEMPKGSPATLEE
jgi:hypothetical protein